MNNKLEQFIDLLKILYFEKQPEDLIFSENENLDKSINDNIECHKDWQDAYELFNYFKIDIESKFKNLSNTLSINNQRLWYEKLLNEGKDLEQDLCSTFKNVCGKEPIEDFIK